MKVPPGHSLRRRAKPPEFVLPELSAPDSSEAKEAAEHTALMERFDKALKRAMSRRPKAFVMVTPPDLTDFALTPDQTEEINQAPELPNPKPGPHNQ